jgi:hypothetical protein
MNRGENMSEENRKNTEDHKDRESSDQKSSPEPAAKPDIELSEDELKKIAGGVARFRDL